MRRVVLFLVVLMFVGACESRVDRYAGEGVIRGVLRINEGTLEDGWVELVELAGPPEDRCGPGDCGLDVSLLAAGTHWNPGRWRVIPPDVPGWVTPGPIEITVRAGELTSFELTYLPGD